MNPDAVRNDAAAAYDNTIRAVFAYINMLKSVRSRRAWPWLWLWLWLCWDDVAPCLE